MMRYISDRQNLRTIMMLLSDPQPNIQFEAFHVFKVFVANPQKSDEVKKLLINNKQRLINYLQRFHNDRAGVFGVALRVHMCVRLADFLAALFQEMTSSWTRRRSCLRS